MTVTVRSGAAAGTKSAASMAEYMAETKDVPELAERLTAYFGEAYGPQAGQVTAAIPARDMHPLAADMMGIDTTRSLTMAEATHLLAGRRADGQPIAGKEIQTSTKDKVRTAFTDFTFSAPKSFSIALAFAETDAERLALQSAFQRANEELCKIIEAHIGGARMGRGGRDGVIPGHMAVFRYNHNTSRPTVQIADGKDTLTIATSEGSAFRPGDMQTHVHNIFLHATITDDGRVRAPDLREAHDRIHEWGALGHAFLVTFLREKGIRAELDPRTGLSFLPSIPEAAVKLFSTRTEQGEIEARKLAEERGIDWDTASAKVKIDLIKTKVAVEREDKSKAPMGDLESWKQRAANAGYEHKPVLDPDYKWELPAPAERTRIAYEAGNPLLGEEFQRNAKLNGSAPRIMAARGMIASGALDWQEIDDVLEAFKSEGITQDGAKTSLISVPEHGKRFGAVTTGLHVDREQEAIRLLKAAGDDRTDAITREEFTAAAGRVAKAKGYDFNSDHGRKQYAFGEAVATAGRAAVGIGVAGVGKTAIASVIVEAHHARGYRSLGVTQAWRQTHGLIDAGVDSKAKRKGPKLRPDTSVLESYGIEARSVHAMDPFLRGAETGRIKLDSKTLVMVDEVATLGTHEILRLARLLDEHKFKLAAMGDDGQCQSISAGHAINLFRHALGEEQVPQLLETIRQKRKEDRETADLWRRGNPDAAAEALARKDKAGLLDLVPGSYTDVIKAGVDWYEKRLAERSDRTEYSIGISVPTNADVRAVGLEIRARQRAAGKLEGEDWIIGAIDQRGVQSDMAIAVGDKVRLFKRTNASLDKKRHGYFGENGTTADIVSIDKDFGLRLRRADGVVGAVRWSSLQDKDTGRILLAYGSALTINARQSKTLTDHLTLLPAGTSAVNAFSIYPADTRNREDSMIIASHGAEKGEVTRHRPIGDPWLAEATEAEMRAEIVANMAKNLGRRPEKQLGIDAIDQAVDVDYGSVNAQTASWFRSETSHEPKTDAPRRQPQETAEDIARVIAAPAKRLAGPRDVREQKRTMRRDAARPKPRAQEKTSVEVHAEFAEALRRGGLRLKGEPVMDGKWHRVAVEGDRTNKKSGRYRGYTDGRPAGFIENYKTGLAENWRSNQPAPVMTAADYRKREAEQMARESERRAAEERAAVRAAGIWSQSKPTRSHAYLVRKGVQAHGLRQTDSGNLVVPMRDATGAVRNAQIITPDGEKRFLSGGRKQGLYSQLGTVNPQQPLLIAEGFATAATLREATGMPVIVAFDAGNLTPVAQSIRAQYPDTPLIFAADNDHHLPRRDNPLPNVGMEKAEAAAKAVNGVVVSPSFGPIEKQPLIDGKTPPTDWNDFAAINGRDQVRQAVASQLQTQGIAMPEPEKKAAEAKQATRITQAERDAARASATAQAGQTAQQQALRQQQTQNNRLGHNQGSRP